MATIPTPSALRASSATQAWTPRAKSAWCWAAAGPASPSRRCCGTWGRAASPSSPAPGRTTTITSPAIRTRSSSSTPPPWACTPATALRRWTSPPSRVARAWRTSSITPPGRRSSCRRSAWASPAPGGSGCWWPRPSGPRNSSPARISRRASSRRSPPPSAGRWRTSSSSACPAAARPPSPWLLRRGWAAPSWMWTPPWWRWAASPCSTTGRLPPPGDGGHRGPRQAQRRRHRHRRRQHPAAGEL